MLSTDGYCLAITVVELSRVRPGMVAEMMVQVYADTVATSMKSTVQFVSFGA